jgi:hypothetical protein
LHELYVTFAEEDAIGLSSLVAQWSPVSRDEPRGYAMRFGGAHDPASPTYPQVSAPLAPGLIANVPVSAGYELIAGRSYAVTAGAGTLALDGEREIECAPDEQYTIELDLHGPLTVDVVKTLRYAAVHRLTMTFPAVLTAAG